MEKEIVLAAIIAAALVWYVTQTDDSNDTQTQDILDDAMTAIDQAKGALSGPNPAAEFTTSDYMIPIMEARESYQSKPYDLNDGGLTWGYGHQGTINETAPAFISKEDADALFRDDVKKRGEYWVKLYVTVPITQNQFDSLVSIALNMSPRSFKLFADAVNAGQGIDAMAQQSIGWMEKSHPKFVNGITARRRFECQVFNTGNYTV